MSAHSSSTPEGNDIADEYAKLGTVSSNIQLDVFLPYAHLKSKIETKIRHEWKVAFNSTEISGDLNQSRRLLNGPRSDIAKIIDNSNRKISREIVQIITGHGPFLHDQVNKGYAVYNLCRICNESEDETSWHILCECPVLNEWRNSTLGFFNCNDQKLVNWKPSSVKKFLKSAVITENICYLNLVNFNDIPVAI